MPARASGAGAPGEASATSAPTADASPTRERWRGSARWRSRRPGPMSGSARIANGHLQATGRDARGRKQYRYHPRLAQRARRGQVRPHDRLRPGAAAHPRGASTRDLRRPGLPREKVLATVVRLLEATLIRVGNEEYARDNKLLRPDHAARPPRARSTAARSTSASAARAASARRRACDDRRLARIVARCRDLPGPGAVPVPRRRRRAAHRRLEPTSTTTCARSPARTSPPRTSAPGRARCWPRWPCRNSRRSTPRPGQEEHRARHRGGRRAAGQHAGRLPQVLRAPGGARRLPGRRRRCGPRARRRTGTLRNDLRRLSPQEAAVLALLRQRLRAEERGRA